VSTISRAILRNIGFIALLFLFTSAFSSSVFATNNPCNTDFVTIDASGDLLVSASKDKTGLTDTTNLQCATNAIEKQSFDTIKLKTGNFYIKEISLTRPSSKTCTISGTSKAGTIIDVVDGSIDCQGQFDKNITVAGLTVRGKITVQFLTINGNLPCMGAGFLTGLIVFTGSPAIMGSDCNNSVLFGTLNRVDINASSFLIDTGVLVSPQGRRFEGTCQDRLSGTFTSIRTTINGPFVGIAVSMQAGARAGIDFLETNNTMVGVLFIDSNLIANLNFCTISGASTPDDSFRGVIVLREAGAPNITNTNIYKCTFNIESSTGTAPAFGISASDNAAPSTMPISVSTNTFNLVGPVTRGIELDDILNCTLIGNRFIGSGSFAIGIFSLVVPVTGCTMTANTGFATFPTIFNDLFLSDGTTDNIVGPQDGVDVRDDGCNFDLNDPGGGCAQAAVVLAKNSILTDSLMSYASGPLISDNFLAYGEGIKQFRHALMKHKPANR